MINNVDDFGIIITCTAHDFIFAKGCAASAKYFMPDVPLCLLVDGDFDLEQIQSVYDATIIKKEDIGDEFLRNNSFGWGLTKMNAFWESPFSTFLLIDADTNIWGNIRQYANFMDYDFIVDVPCGSYSTEEINMWFFDTNQMQQDFFSFDCFNQPFVCTGVLFAKRDVLPLECYVDITKYITDNPAVFKFAEMGFLNYLLFKLSGENNIRLGCSDIQYIACDFDPGDTKKRFFIENAKPKVTENPCVIHWPGDLKPIQENPYGFYEYVEPMTFFRKQYLRDSTTLSEEQISRRIVEEERDRIKKIKKSRLKLKIFSTAKSVMNKFSFGNA